MDADDFHNDDGTQDDDDDFNDDHEDELIANKVKAVENTTNQRKKQIRKKYNQGQLK